MRIYIQNYYENIKTADELKAIFFVLNEDLKQKLINKYNTKLSQFIPDSQSLFDILKNLKGQSRKLLCEKIEINQTINTPEELQNLLMLLFSENDKLMILKILDLEKFNFKAKDISEILQWLCDKNKEFLFNKISINETIHNFDDFCYIAQHFGKEIEKDLITKHAKLLKREITDDDTLIKILHTLTRDGDQFLLSYPFIKKLKINKKYCKNYLPQDLITQL